MVRKNIELAHRKISERMNIEKLAMSVATKLFLNKLPEKQKKKLVELYHNTAISILVRKCGIEWGKIGNKIYVEKGGKTIITSTNDSLFNIVKGFDSIFKIKELNIKNDTIDFTKDVQFLGYRVKTLAESLLWTKPILEEYNKYYKIKGGDIVFDCGAHHGLYSLLISRAVGKNGMIYCFEPDDENYRILTGNVRKNGIKNIKVVKMGLWSGKGRALFRTNLGHSSHIIIGTSANARKKNIESIRLTTIADFSKEMKLKKIDFMKMDIEGAEIEAIEGSLAFIKNNSVNFAIASYHIRENKPTALRLEKLFKSIGYWVSTEKNSAGELITYAHQ